MLASSYGFGGALRGIAGRQTTEVLFTLLGESPVAMREERIGTLHQYAVEEWFADSGLWVSTLPSTSGLMHGHDTEKHYAS